MVMYVTHAFTIWSCMLHMLLPFGHVCYTCFYHLAMYVTHTFVLRFYVILFIFGKIGGAKLIDLGCDNNVHALIKLFILKFGGFRVSSLGLCILSPQLSFCLWSWWV